MCEIASTRITNSVRFGNIGTIAHCSNLFNADIVTWFSILSFIVWALRENGDWWYSVGNWVDIWYF